MQTYNILSTIKAQQADARACLFNNFNEKDLHTDPHTANNADAAMITIR